MRRAILAVLALWLVLPACSQQSAEMQSGGAAQAVAEGEGPAMLPGETGAAVLPRLGPAVIKEATLDLEVEADAFRGAIDSATAVAADHGGYVLSSSVEGEEGRIGSVVLRVPSSRFEEALGALRGLGTVRAESVSGREVGQQFVDLEARLRNARAQQTVLLDLMGNAVSIPGTIHVQRELERVQLEIEQITGRLRYLRDRTALGTITVQLAEVGAAAPGMLARAWDSAADVLAGLAYAGIVAGAIVVPLGAVGLAGFAVWRRLRRRASVAG